MPFIHATATATPDYKLSLDDVVQFGSDWLVDKPKLLALFERFVRSSHTMSRSFVLSYEELLTPPSFAKRAEMFESIAPNLGATALRDALARSEIEPSELSTLIFTSCSCPTIPAVDAVVIEEMRLSSSVSRIPIFQHGCAGGVVGLSLANKLAKTEGAVALLSVELCSLVFQPQLPSPAELIGAALFADGAASCIVSPVYRKGSIEFKDSRSFLIPHSRHLMGYDIFDDGFHLRLSRELPLILSSTAPEQVRVFLGENNLSEKDVAYWLFHPGGIKILDFLEASLDVSRSQCRWSREVLSEVGNLSSATVIFVLDRFLHSRECKPGDRVVMMGIGPGLTLELILFQMPEEQ